MPHWLISSRSYACTINLYTSDCGIWWLWYPGWSHLPVAKSVVNNFMCFCWWNLRYTLFSCVFMCVQSWVSPSTLYLLSAVRRTEASWKICTTWKCFLLHHMFPVYSDSHTFLLFIHSEWIKNSGYRIAVCMQELTYSLYLHTDITVQYRSHTCLPTALTDIWLLQPVCLYRCSFGCCYRHMHPYHVLV
jgi:hypothetical protein